MLLMLFLGKHVLRRTYLKLLISVGNKSTLIFLGSLSSYTLRSKNSYVLVATYIVNRIFLVGSTLFM